MKFLLDEGVTVSAGKVLQDAGHEVIFFNASGLAKSSSDPLVCITALASDAILVAQDGDMKTLARGHGITPARFKSLTCSS
jgi:predicted nuclease of predicted toxin-antitoxin system